MQNSCVEAENKTNRRAGKHSDHGEKPGEGTCGVIVRKTLQRAPPAPRPPTADLLPGTEPALIR